VDQADTLLVLLKLESLCNKNGKIIIELLIKEDKSKNVVSENYSKDRTVKKDIIEIALFNKIVKYLILLFLKHN
jgi:hypothetical protein